MEEVGERWDQVHSGSRQVAVRTIKPHGQAAEMLSRLWGFFSYVYGKTLLLKSSRGYFLIIT